MNELNQMTPTEKREREIEEAHMEERQRKRYRERERGCDNILHIFLTLFTNELGM